MSIPKLFQPIKVGTSELKHRVAFAPSTRFRSDEAHVPAPIVAEYYEQRGSVAGTLLVTEATFIAPQAGGYASVPGIWSEAQIAAWKTITDRVHAKGSFIYLQLWALGRAANSSELAKEGHPYVSASDVPLKSYASAPPPRPLSIAEIQEYLSLYATAASNAVHKAGFDGVEIHGANGYLIDQFLQDVSNKRTDAYGGSIENRAKFALEVVDAVVKAVGAEKTAIRFSPWNTFQDMAMADPKPTFAYVVSKLRDQHPDLAYIHVVEPRAQGLEVLESVPKGHDNDFIREIWAPRPLLSAGGYTRELAIEVAEKKGDIIAFSRAFIANPDLPYRLEKDIPLTKGDRSTYYSLDLHNPKGYTDYPFAPRESGESRL